MVQEDRILDTIDKLLLKGVTARAQEVAARNSKARDLIWQLYPGTTLFVLLDFTCDTKTDIPESNEKEYTDSESDIQQALIDWIYLLMRLDEECSTLMRALRSRGQQELTIKKFVVHLPRKISATAAGFVLALANSGLPDPEFQ